MNGELSYERKEFLAVSGSHPAAVIEVVCPLPVAFMIDKKDPCYGRKEVNHAYKDECEVSFSCRITGCHGDHTGSFFHTYMEYKNRV